MTRIYQLGTGVMRAVRLIENVEKVSQERPILVAVYGLPHSGKSYFIERVYERLIIKDYHSIAREGSAGNHVFE